MRPAAKTHLPQGDRQKGGRWDTGHVAVAVIVVALMLAGCNLGQQPSPVPASATPTRALPPTQVASRPPLAAAPTPTGEGRDRNDFYFPFVGNGQASPTPEPTETPKPEKTRRPKPTPTPKWPEPLPEPGRSKLGLHVIRNNSPDIMDFIRVTKPAVVKAVDDLHWLEEVKKDSPKTVTIGRINVANQERVGDPVEAARAFVAEHLAEYQYNSGVDYWEGWNEPDPDGDMAWYAQFEAERARQMAAHGLRVAVGGFPAGVPEWEEFAAFLPAIEAARQYGGILTLHEYGAPTMDYLVGAALPGRPTYPNRGALALRYRWWYEDFLKPRGLVIPLVISEAGIDGLVNPSGPKGLGWQDFTRFWSQRGLGNDGTQTYIGQLAWYDSQLQQDDYVIGFTVFTAGAIDPWESYDITQILVPLAFYVVGQR